MSLTHQLDFRNTTTVPDRILRGLLDFSMRYAHYPASALVGARFCRWPRNRSTPGRGEAYPWERRIRVQFNHRSRFPKDYLLPYLDYWIHLQSRYEYLLMLIAHEIVHLSQSRQNWFLDRDIPWLERDAEKRSSDAIVAARGCGTIDRLLDTTTRRCKPAHPLPCSHLTD